MEFRLCMHPLTVRSVVGLMIRSPQRCLEISAMTRHLKSDTERAMAQIPGGIFVMTAAFEGRASAVLVKWVQPCSEKPAMVMVALNRGQPIEPLLRNSRSFALCQISESDRFLLRKFSAAAASEKHAAESDQHADEHDADPLVSIMTTLAPSGSPIVDRAMTYLDCEIIRHIELESDYRIYVGHVHHGAVLNKGAPAVQFGGNGSAPAH